MCAMKVLLIPANTERITVTPLPSGARVRGCRDTAGRTSRLLARHGIRKMEWLPDTVRKGMKGRPSWRG